MKTPHKHAELIKAWADGAGIEYMREVNDSWVSIPSPSWAAHTKYRIKPEPTTDTEFINRGCHYQTELTQPKQEPVGEVVSMEWLAEGFTVCVFEAKNVTVGTKLYTAPPKRQPLTDDEHDRLMRGRSTLNYGRAVEAAHDIKETT